MPETVETLVDCHDCGEQLHAHDTTTDNRGRTYCQGCYDNRYFICEGCGGETNISYACSHDGYSYCQSCYDDRWTFCEECGEECDVDDIADGLCLSCQPGEDADQAKSIPVPRIADPGYLTRRAIGIELEVIDGGRCELDMEAAGWRALHDGSLSGAGLEYVLGPTGGQAAIDKVTAAQTIFWNHGTTINKNCGFHLHLDMTAETAETVAKFVRLCKRLENWTFSVVPPSRRDNNYCQRLADSANHCLDYDDLEVVAYAKNRPRGRKSEKYDDARYCWCNVHSWFYRGTVEIRLHSGTCDPEKILRWAELWLLAVEFAKRHSLEVIDAVTSGHTVLAAQGARQSTIEYFIDRAEKFA